MSGKIFVNQNIILKTATIFFFSCNYWTIVFIFLFISLLTCVECSIWNEESSHSKSNQNQELEEPETEKEKKSHWHESLCKASWTETGISHISKKKKNAFNSRVQHLLVKIFELVKILWECQLEQQTVKYTRFELKLVDPCCFSHESWWWRRARRNRPWQSTSCRPTYSQQWSHSSPSLQSLV